MFQLHFSTTDICKVKLKFIVFIFCIQMSYKSLFQNTVFYQLFLPLASRKLFILENKIFVIHCPVQ